MALGSPARMALRTFGRLLPDPAGKMTRQHPWKAFEVAAESLNLYNKPETVCSLRLTTATGDYWRQGLRHGGNGCLQTVVDEYGHSDRGKTRRYVAELLLSPHAPPLNEKINSARRAQPLPHVCASESFGAGHEGLPDQDLLRNTQSDNRCRLGTRIVRLRAAGAADHGSIPRQCW
jgi:hypothetical protein